MPTENIPAAKRGLDFRTVWRWHFYAGLFCIPFVLWLSVTGTIFLFHPQIQRWLDRPYDHLSITGPEAPVNLQVRAAIAAVSGSHLHAYQLPFTAHSPAQVLVDKGTAETRVYVDPRTLQVLKMDDEDRRIDNFISRLHGELLIGKWGSWIVELAASWAVIMVITGLFLWWPRSANGLGGVLYPRLRQGRRIFWRDIHSVMGIYVSVFALFLLLTGLPWAKSWGAYLKAARHLGAGHAVKQDWTTGSAEIVAARAAARAVTPTNDMADMRGMADAGSHAAPMNRDGFAAIDRIAASVAPLGLPNPVLISPPKSRGANWTAKSDTRDRPLRVDLTLDGTGAILKRTDFHAKPWLDRVIGTGIAAHEGFLFGVANQLLGLFTTIGLVTLSVSGLVMWWRRKPEGQLGAPVPVRRVRFSAVLIAAIVALGTYFPFLGGSMILVVLAERFVLRRIPRTARWLGLPAPQPFAS
jgi:uncharacterized iron-regulated membrane protein